MLMHHADAHLNGFLGAVDIHRLAVDTDLAGSGAVQAVQDVHERTLSRTVFAQDRVNFAFVDGQVDAVIGGEIAEFLHDATHLNDRRGQVHVTLLRQKAPSLSVCYFKLYYLQKIR